VGWEVAYDDLAERDGREGGGGGGIEEFGGWNMWPWDGGGRGRGCGLRSVSQYRHTSTADPESL
jgi:hypothetical protein